MKMIGHKSILIQTRKED